GPTTSCSKRRRTPAGVSRPATIRGVRCAFSGMRRLRGLLPLGAILVAILLASCGMPGATLRVSGANEALPGLEGSYCQSGGCSGSCGDYGPLVPTLVQVRVTPP